MALGQTVSATPVVDQNIVIVATAMDGVFGLDAANGSIRWRRTVGAA
ncbi:MAG: hypothetical protein JOZ75_11385, partial [Candidatus Dormibacteraeota bacterium]|nr:hypothetical protein [Candidatus Dormibacteraeota bacterium]